MTDKTVNLRERAGPGRLSAEEVAKLPERLLDAASALFLEQGYGDTTMEQIARAAGASTKTLYSRYQNKADILRAVVSRIVERTVAAHWQDLPADPARSEPRAHLSSLCGQIARRIATEAAGLNRLAHFEANRFPEFRQMHDMAVAHGAALIRTALEVWRDRGLLPWIEDVERSAALCLSMTTDWVRIRTSLGDAPDDSAISEHVGFAVDMFLRACGYSTKATRVRR